MKNRNFLRLVAAIILIALTLGSCAGADGTEAAPSAVPSVPDASDAQLLSDDRLTLAVSAGDTLDPFTAATQNNIIVTNLIYEPLILLNDGYTAVECLALSYTQDSASIAVTVNSSVTFSDGAPLTAQDVAYSFERALTSPEYAAGLSGIVSAQAADSETVTFAFSRPLRYAERLLTFPVMSAATGLGTGRYCLSPDGLGLVPNANYRETAATDTISFYAVSDTASMADAYRNKSITFIYDSFDDGFIRRHNGTSVSVQLNRFVFLGFNSVSGAMSDSRLRRTVCALTDTAMIASDAYHGYAAATSIPINPAWDSVRDRYASDRLSDPQTAAALLNELGYTGRGADGVLTNGDSALTLTLLVNNENTMRESCADIIAESLRAAGIGVTITAVSYEEYTAALAAGSFDMYIGEVRLPGNMDLFPFFGDSAAAAYGIAADSASRDAYNGFCAGTITDEQLIAAFDSELPFMPLCFRCASASYYGTLPTDFRLS